MDVLRKTQQDLNDGQAKLDKMAATIDTESEECEKAISLLTSKLPELKEEMEKRSNEEELPIEDAIETTAPIYKQLLLSFAEEQAIEDALYILGDSLRREVIEIEPYLKKVRDLSRKQFMLRALIQKCREKAGLSDVYS
ncbi:TSG101 [Bugula neritina]|nr:TSG101 [Bugula neritina]